MTHFQPKMRIQTEVACPIYDSFRVRQVAGLFDLPLQAKVRERFEVELPEADESWRIGVIAGPSGSGKSTIARQAYGEAVCRDFAWPADRAVIDCLGDRPIKEITHMLTAVGFSSPPAWIKPYAVLSTGQRFRCDLARALLDGGELVVFDEFTSVVDRTVAKIGSAAVARAVRATPSRRFVAVTCHHDVLEWLEPDWVLDMATGTLDRRRLRRPGVKIEVVRCRHDAWRTFASHHYLSGHLNKAARCYLATWDGEPVAFCALLAAIGRRGIWRISRIVVLPDYQGVGIGSRFCRAIAELYAEQGQRTTITTSHPAMVAYLRASRHWRIRAVTKGGSSWRGFAARKSIRSTSGGRTVVSAEYSGT